MPPDFSSDIPAQPTKGSYNVKEAYAEVNAPLLADRPFADLLEFTGAVRFSDYSTSGSTTTFKAGAELEARSRTCACALPGRKVSGRRRSANCSAPRRGSTSVSTILLEKQRGRSELQQPIPPSWPTALLQAFRGGHQTLPDDQLSVIIGGNEDLNAETSKSWVLGGVYSPSFIPRFSVEANWYKIRSTARSRPSLPS